MHMYTTCANTQRCTHTHIHAHTHAHAHICMHKHKHMCTPNTHTQKQAHTNTTSGKNLHDYLRHKILFPLTHYVSIVREQHHTNL